MKDSNTNKNNIVSKSGLSSSSSTQLTTTGTTKVLPMKKKIGGIKLKLGSGGFGSGTNTNIKSIKIKAPTPTTHTTIVSNKKKNNNSIYSSTNINTNTKNNNSLDAKLSSLFQAKRKVLLDEKEKKEENIVEKDEFDEIFPTEAFSDLPCDTKLAFQSLVQSHTCAYCTTYDSTSTKSIAFFPFVLRNMLYDLLTHYSNNNDVNKFHQKRRTQATINDEITNLQKENKIRLLKLNLPPINKKNSSSSNNKEDVGVMETSAYIQALNNAFQYTMTDQNWATFFSNSQNNVYNSSSNVEDKNIQKRIHVSSCKRIQEIFLKEIVPQNTGISITHTSLLQSKKLSTSDIDYLVKTRILLPSSSSDHHHHNHKQTSSYWFILPTLGEASKKIHEGRRRVLEAIRKSRFKEVTLKTIEDNYFSFLDKKSNNGDKTTSIWKNKRQELGTFTALFHVKDLMAKGIIQSKMKAYGEFYGLV